MSYCRWSSDNFQCDVYAYGDVRGGYTIHVATNRSEPNSPDLVEINLPHAGETFREPDLTSFWVRLVVLREIGYRVPAYVLKRIEDEIYEQQSQT